MAEKLPWFPAYAFAWLTDEAVRAMDYESRGIYFDLLCHQWLHGSVPTGETLTRLLGPHRPESLVAVLGCFEANRSDPSRCFNPRLEEVRAEQARRVQAAVVNGRKGGIVSGLTRRRLASSDDEATLKRPSSIASISTSTDVVVAGEASSNPGTEELHRPGKALVSISRKEIANQAKTAHRRTRDNGLHLAAQVVFIYWRDRMGFDPQRTILNEQREKRIIARLKENGGDISELLYCVDGAVRDPWTMGTDPRSTKAFNGLQTVLRDREKVEELLKLVTDRGEMHPYLEADDAETPTA